MTLKKPVALDFASDLIILSKRASVYNLLKEGISYPSTRVSRNLNLSFVIPVLRRIDSSVPCLRVLLLCTGTGTVIVPSSATIWYIL
ncbi:hypothetical protein LCGC14_3060170 [marine sediment metagenome]|uniref:Uncharacterized protein n=1 Tax=marine sediment metagenome TaxID=412755 RepID=A0A0F8WJ40_9ZZZZ